MEPTIIANKKALKDKRILINAKNIFKTNIPIMFQFLHLLFFISFSCFPITNSSQLINIDNKDINTISYSDYIKNSHLGNILFTENQLKNITDSIDDLSIEYSLSSPFIKIGQKAKLELVPKTDFSILNSVYFQKGNNNLTYFKDYLITFNVDDSVIPFYNFHAEGVKNSSFYEDLFDEKSDEIEYHSKQLRNKTNPKPSSNFFKDKNKKLIKKEYDVSCEYTDKGLIYQAFEYTPEIKLIKIESLQGLNLALTSDNKLIRMRYNAKAPNKPVFTQMNFTEDLLFIGNNTNNNTYSVSINQRKFDDFYLVNQFYETGTFIFGLSANTNTILVYNITYWYDNENILLKLFTEFDLKEIFKVNNVIFSPNSTNILNNSSNYNENLPTITKFGTYKDTIVISTLEKGLIFLDKNPVSGKWDPKFITSVSFKNSTHHLKIRDMNINKNTIYIICEKYGMKIWDLEKKDFTKFEFNHPHLLRFDSNFPDNMPSPFYGLLVDNSVLRVNELFIELKLQDENEFEPQINRIFISEYKSAQSPYYLKQQSKNGLVSFTNQNKLGVIFDRQNERILLVDRGVPNFAETYTYKIDLKDFNFLNNRNQTHTILDVNHNNTNIDINSINSNSNYSDAEIFVFSSNTEIYNPVILLKYSEKEFYLFTEIKYSNVTFICEFNDDGDFKMNLIYSTVCRKDYSSGSFDSYHSCPFVLTIPMQVQGGINVAMWIITGLIAIALIFLVVFIICCFRGKRSSNHYNKRDRDVKYSQAESQGPKNNNYNEKNNEIIEVQIIDYIK